MKTTPRSASVSQPARTLPAKAVSLDNSRVYREACSRFLPTTREEMNWRGWDELDVLLVSGDAYVDHPSFGIPCLGRWLEKLGLRVGIVAQPRFRKKEEALADFKRMGRPRLFVGVSSGTVDSMINNYTANKNNAPTTCTPRAARAAKGPITLPSSIPRSRAKPSRKRP